MEPIRLPRRIEENGGEAASGRASDSALSSRPESGPGFGWVGGDAETGIGAQPVACVAVELMDPLDGEVERFSL